MNHATNRNLGPSKEAILGALERLAHRERAQAHASGFYTVDAFAGLERLDREELDETDEG